MLSVGFFHDQPFLITHRDKPLHSRVNASSGRWTLDYLHLTLVEAVKVFGDQAKAAVWMSQARNVFEGLSAAEVAVDLGGYERVKAELKRLANDFHA